MTPRLFASAAALLALAVASVAQDPSFVGYVPDECVVVLTDGAGAVQALQSRQGTAVTGLKGLDAIAARLGVRDMRRQFGPARSGDALGRFYKVRFPAGNLDSVMAAYRASPLVDHVEPIGIHRLQAVPDDYFYDRQWHLEQASDRDIDATAAWSIEQGSEEIILAILDSGVRYFHRDLGGSRTSYADPAAALGNMWINVLEKNGLAGVDDDGNGYVDDWIGWDFVDGGDEGWPGEDVDTQDNDCKADFSSHGTWVDISAPGTGIFSPYHDHTDLTPDYMLSESGTSMSSPLAAGVAAAIWSRHPSWTAAQVRTRLLTTADNIDGLACNTAYAGQLGAGRVNARAALDDGSPVRPRAAFGMNAANGCAPLTVQFTDFSTGTYSSRLWEFGDGATSAAQHPGHVYSDTGVYTVKLTVSGANGSSSHTQLNRIRVGRIPVVSFTGDVTSGPAPLTVRFTDRTSGVPAAWDWSFGDGLGTSRLQNPSRTYVTPGTYTVALTVRNACDTLTYTRTNYITVTAPVGTSTAKAQADSLLLGTIVSGSYLSTRVSDNTREQIREQTRLGQYSLLDHRWRFTVTPNTRTVLYLEGYRQDNAYDNFDIAYSTDGGTTFTYLFTVASAVEQVYSAVLPASPSGVVYVRAWDTDETRFETALTSLYIDSLSLVSDAQAAPPWAEFLADTTRGAPPFTVSFSDQSVGHVTSWQWAFGDGDSSTQQHPVHVYDSSGLFRVSLTVTGSGGTHNKATSGYIRVENLPPVAVADSVAGLEDEVLACTTCTAGHCGVLANDIDSDPLTAILEDSTSHGELQFHEDGKFQYLPEPDWYGADQFTYRASDSADITVHAVDDPLTVEILGGDTLTALPGTPIAADARDPDGPAVARVEFYCGAVKVAEDNTAPYEFDGLQAAPGAHTLTALAVAVNGDTARSDTVILLRPWRIMPLGNSITEAVTATPGDASYRCWLWNLLDGGGYLFDFVGSRHGVWGGGPLVTEAESDCPYAAFDEEHEGHYGWRVDEILYSPKYGGLTLGDWMEQYVPDAVLMHLGTNDMFQRQSVPGTITEIGRAIDTVRSHNPSAVIYLARVIGTTRFNTGGRTGRDTITIYVTPIADPPVASNDSYSTPEDITLAVAAPGVLANDTDPDTPPASLTAALVSGVAHGSLTLNANGSFSYTPQANWSGSDAFTYRAYDGAGYSSTATVSLTITPVNDPPVITWTPVTSATEGALYSYTVATLDTHLVYTASAGLSGLDLADVNHDSRPDLFLSYEDGTVDLALSDGASGWLAAVPVTDGSAAPVKAGSDASVACVQLTPDSLLSLVVGNAAGLV